MVTGDITRTAIAAADRGHIIAPFNSVIATGDHMFINSQIHIQILGAWRRNLIHEGAPLPDPSSGPVLASACINAQYRYW